MTTSLDTIRYHSGIAGEEVADMVDSLEQEVSTLREQVEKLTKDAERYRKWRHSFREGECELFNALSDCATNEEHDAAIDHAMQEDKP